MKLIMIGALGTMLGPSSKHLLDDPDTKILRILDRGTPGTIRDEYRAAWDRYGAQRVRSIDALVAEHDFDGLVLCAGKNGDDYELLSELIRKLPKYIFIAHFSTVSCTFVTVTRAFCAQYDIDYLNYPLTGGAVGAKNGTMLILACGPINIYHRLESFLKKIGNPRYLGPNSKTGAETKLIGHVLVFHGLLGICSALTLQARCAGKTDFFETQVALFDFLNQGAGGTKQWDVALKNGVAQHEWDKGFLLKHAAVDLLYLLDLMIEKNQCATAYTGLFELAYSFAYLLQQGLEDSATQILARYWLIPECSHGLYTFLEKNFDVTLTAQEKLTRCIALLPDRITKTVLLSVNYTAQATGLS